MQPNLHYPPQERLGDTRARAWEVTDCPWAQGASLQVLRAPLLEGRAVSRTASKDSRKGPGFIPPAVH